MIKNKDDFKQNPSKHKLLTWGLILIFLVISAFSFKNLNIQQDITQTLPQSSEFKTLKELINHKGINKKIMLSLGVVNDDNFEEIISVADSVITLLQNDTNNQIENLTFEVQEGQEDFIQVYQQNIPFLLDPEQLNAFNSRTTKEAIEERILKNHEKLYSTQGFFVKDLIFKDPLGTMDFVFEDLNNLKANFPNSVQDDILFTKDGNHFLIVGDCSIGMEETEKMIQLSKNLKELQKNLKKQDIEFNYFSGILVAAENAIQVKKDINLTIGLTILGIILVLLLAYRNFIIPILFLVPAVLGFLFSLSVLSLFNYEISGISIAAGAVVIGIIMDYSFHFFSHLGKSGSVKQNLKEILNPLLVGSATTILAFIALVFTNSKVLIDFGIFASLSLLGALISVVFVLPMLVSNTLVDKLKSRENKEDRTPKSYKKLKLGIAVLILGFTAFSITKFDEFEFDNNLDNLSYHPQELKDAESFFTEKDPTNDKQVFIISQGESLQESQAINRRVFQTLKHLKEEGKINSFISSGSFDLTKKELQKNQTHWVDFWKNKPYVIRTIDSLAEVLNYAPDAFADFKQQIQNPKFNFNLYNISFNASLISSLHDKKANQYSIISSLIVDLQHKEEVKTEIAKAAKVKILDNNALTHSLVELIKDDFDYILFASSGIVFIVLLIIYGRFELAFCTFLPMVISWIMIIGFSVILEIKFNFVNIIITTFIFGLGDDFAIFISEGYLEKYKTGKDKLSSFNTSILLSSITTILGTGVLIFAKHPAIQSIGALAVIGMVSIVLVSYIIQPALLKFFLVNRQEKKLPPVTLSTLLISCLSFLFFFIGCIFLFVIHLVFKAIPFQQKRLKATFRKCIQAFSWLIMKVNFHVKFDIKNKERLNLNEPGIIISNHQSFIDVLAITALSSKVIIMTNEWVYKSPFFGRQIRYAGYLPAFDGIEQNQDKIKEYIQDGISVVIFPEGRRSYHGEILRFHKGAFYLSEQLKVNITPILLHGFNHCLKKGDFLLHKGKLTISILETLRFDDPSWGETYNARSKAACKYYRAQLVETSNEIENSQYLFDSILTTYLFKGPVTEWYFRVKWKLEQKNYSYYNTLIGPKDTVLDVGCGLGYMSFFLALKERKRTILGYDFDEHKIEVAQNSHLVDDNIQFEACDATQKEFPQADVVFCMDVLHYLTPEQQLGLLVKFKESIGEKGKIIIRDGVKDFEKRHQTTELTEKFSTQIFKFNKTQNQLSFFDKQFIQDFADTNAFDLEIIEQRQNTSNILFVLTKA